MSKKPTKTIIVKLPKAPKFNLSFADEKENARILSALDSLKQNIGWLFLTQILEENKKVIAKQIIEKEADGVVLTENDVDNLRSKYGYLKELLEKPDYYIKQLRKENVTQTSLDPYDTGEK